MKIVYLAFIFSFHLSNDYIPMYLFWWGVGFIAQFGNEEKVLGYYKYNSFVLNAN